MEICDLMNINELLENSDLQVKYFQHIHCWKTPQNFMTSCTLYAISSKYTANKLTHAVVETLTFSAIPWL